MKLVTPANRLMLAAAPLLLLALLAAGGCTRTTPFPTKTALLPVNSFDAHWRLPLELAKTRDEIQSLHLRDNTLFAYTRRNTVVAMTAGEGKPLWSARVTPDQVGIKDPIIVKDRVGFPTSTSIEMYHLATGKPAETFRTPRSIRSGGILHEDTIYLGLDYPAGGRLAAIDLTRKYDRVRWEVMSRGGVSATPTVYQNNIYYADELGAVYAINEDKAPVWPLEGSAFRTDGKIVADLKSDEGGVYVASFDSKLYCLETGTGRVRWQYYAGTPLTVSPVVTSDTVYQAVRGAGIVAIEKSQGKSNRDAKWIARGATQFLSQDDRHVYLRGRDNRIIAVDRATGEEKFRSTRNDFVAFATNTQTPMIYASAANGLIVGIRPITTPGTVGTLVMGPAGETIGFEAVASR